MNSKEMKSYKIESKWRFNELYAYTLQYPEWKAQLNDALYLSAQDMDGIPKGTQIGDPAGELAIKYVELFTKVATVEKCAKLCSSEPHIQQAVLKGVTTYGATYDLLRQRGEIYCGKRQYYEARRRFYWFLDKNI